MSILTTTIGSYPKPSYVPFLDWFQAEDMSPIDSTQDTAYDLYLTDRDPATEKLLDSATREVIQDQIRAGIDIPTDGEIRRENYIYYHCRHLSGISFAHLTKKTIREGTFASQVPTITGSVKAHSNFLPHDWSIAQSFSKQPIKMTIPGPMTIADTLVDAYYHDERRLNRDLAEALNIEIRALVKAGCRWIQIDEPMFARNSSNALAYGIDNLDRCFYRVPKNVMRVVHLCCGYPVRVNQEDYPKADASSYFALADALDTSRINAVSIEDAHRHNDLALLERFKQTTIILGVIAIAKSKIESIDEIRNRLIEARDHIELKRLMAAPDCGLGMLDRDIAYTKLAHMVQAARSL